MTDTPKDLHTHSTHTQDDAPNAYQRMLKACQIVGAQPWAKNFKNSQFSSIPIDDMRSGVREACCKAGLVHIGPEDIDYERTRDGTQTRIWGQCRFRYVNVDDPQDQIVYTSLGEAMDNGDKATGKFLTNLIKNHYKFCFDIGEQGIDDIDKYTAEDIYGEAARIEAQKQARAQARREAMAKDPFFGKPSKSAPSMAVVTDRDPAVMRECVVNYSGDPRMAKELRPCQLAWGTDIKAWTDDQIKTAYAKCVKAMREAGQ